jgi:hypothetical protein
VASAGPVGATPGVLFARLHAGRRRLSVNEGSKGCRGRERAGQSPRHSVTQSPGPRPSPRPRPRHPVTSDVTST